MSQELTFDVQGSTLYQITFKKKKKRVHVSCSCPANGHCKHIAEIFRDALDESVKKKTGKDRVLDQSLWPEIVGFVQSMDFSDIEAINREISAVDDEIKRLKDGITFLKQKRNELFDRPEYGSEGKGFPVKE